MNEFPRDISGVLDALTHSITALSDDICGLRMDVSDLRSDLRSVREQNARQDREIWAPDGLSRLGAIQGDSQKQALQIKGLWAIVGALLGFIVSYAITRMQ